MGTGLISTDAAWSMIRALSAVARINRIPRRKFTWRHGSLLGRQQHLRDLIGRPVFPLPVDLKVRWIKRGTLLALVALAGMTLFAAAA